VLSYIHMRFWQRLKHHFVPTPQNAYRPHLLGRTWLMFFLAAILATEGFLVASLVARQSGGSFLAAVVQSEIISLTNTERSQNNDGALTENIQLDAAAQAKANDMAAKGYFSHTGPDGKTPWQWIEEKGYAYHYAGENLAVRFDDSESVVNAWMASPTHRANIVKSQYTQIGVGVAQGMYEGYPATFVVQYFGTPLKVVAAPSGAPSTAATASRGVPATSSVAAEAHALVPVSSQVLGASASIPQQTDSLLRQLLRSFNDHPQSSTAWILGSIAALLILILGLTFVMHLQVQATDLLLPGLAVALIAVCLVGVNTTVIGGSAQMAAAGNAHISGVVLSPDAAATVR
jgi:hypothetical protein